VPGIAFAGRFGDGTGGEDGDRRSGARMAASTFICYRLDAGILFTTLIYMRRRFMRFAIRPGVFLAVGLGYLTASCSAQQESASNVALSWSRDGGFAGFCDEMKVSVSGEVRATSCRPVAGRSGRLSKENLARLDRWRKSFGSVVIEMKDPPGNDAMTVALTLKGTGRGQPTEVERQEILDWAQRVYEQNRP
jgi:hypothetical protein